jgi:hypothetical protein
LNFEAVVHLRIFQMSELDQKAGRWVISGQFTLKKTRRSIFISSIR